MNAILQPVSPTPAHNFPAASLVGKLAARHGDLITGHFTLPARPESSVTRPTTCRRPSLPRPVAELSPRDCRAGAARCRPGKRSAGIGGSCRLARLSARRHCRQAPQGPQSQFAGLKELSWPSDAVSLPLNRGQLTASNGLRHKHLATA